VQARPAASQVQDPATHWGAFAPQTVPHPPQFIGSAEVSMQAPPQQAWPAAHAAPVAPQPHMPLVQLSPSAHIRPTSPQLLGSKRRSAQM